MNRDWPTGSRVRVYPENRPKKGRVPPRLATVRFHHKSGFRRFDLVTVDYDDATEPAIVKPENLEAA
jgi:hypothetical protein